MVRPILFNTDMVRAILDGRKTVTRRKIDIDISNWFDVEKDGKTVVAYIDQATGDSYKPEEICMYHPGNILYVRETWQRIWKVDDFDQTIEGTDQYYYKADGVPPFTYYVDPDTGEHREVPWRPSIHMPKEAARIWLKVTDVRVERLQDITGKEILAEGIVNQYSNPANGKRWENMQRMEFENLWNSTIKKSDIYRYGWAANPWVWVIEFEQCEKPEVE